MTQVNSQLQRRMTVEEYLEFEQHSDVKHEFRDGELIDMSGGTLQHSVIIANTIIAIGSRLRGSPCRVFEGNLRVRVKKSFRYVYPDAGVICGPAELDEMDPTGTTVKNPTLVVEVLSKSTEFNDRVDKFHHYLRVPSLKEYVIVSQREPRVESLFRQGDGTWLFANAEGLEAVARLRSIGIEIPLTEVFAGVEFPPEPEEPQPSV